jgi:hypothetical protein
VSVILLPENYTVFEFYFLAYHIKSENTLISRLNVKLKCPAILPGVENSLPKTVSII